MKALTVLVFLLPQILWAQTFRKVNDSTVYKYEQVTITIRADSIIPLAVNGHSNPHLGRGGVLEGEIIYEKMVDSFRLVNGKGFDSKYDFAAAYHQPGTSIMTSKRTTDISYSNFFLTKIYTEEGKVLSFDSKNKMFTLRGFTGTEPYIPYFRWIFVMGVFILALGISKDLVDSFHMGKLATIRDTALISFAASGAAGIMFWVAFSVGNTPWPNIWQVTICWFWGFILILLYNFIYREVVKQKTRKKLQLA